MNTEIDDANVAANRVYSRWLIILSFVIFFALIGFDDPKTSLMIVVPALIGKVILLVLKSRNRRKVNYRKVKSDVANRNRVSFFSDG